MKTLMLLRHAKSDWSQHVADYERPLNHRGVGDAPKMAARIVAYGLAVDRILTSSAERALSTARIMAAKLLLPDDEVVTSRTLYLAPEEELLAMARQCDGHIASLMMVAHNPGLTELVNYFHPRLMDNLPTCGVVCFRFDVATWKEISHDNAVLVFCNYPRKSR